MKTQVQQDKDAPIERNIMAKSVTEIARAMKALETTGLTRRGVIALVHDLTPSVGKRDISIVLAGLSDLEREFCGRG